MEKRTAKGDGRMLKVVIADDEARVCSLIQMLIDWDALGLELCGTASNGLEALDLVKTRHPDILITDIRMPGCHGLELIERAKQESPQLEIVIISGYAHFEYAQSAIRHGVGDYLLKPINKQELMSTLAKLAGRCRTRAQLGSEVEQLRRSSREDQQQLHARLLQDLLSGTAGSLTAERLREEYRLRAQPGLWRVALLSMDYPVGKPGGASVQMIEEKSAKLLHAELDGLCWASLSSFHDGQGALLLGFAQEREKEVRRSLRLVLGHLEAQRAMLGGAEFSIGLSRPVQSPADLPRAVAEARLLLMERLTEGTGRLLETLPPPSPLQRSRLLADYRQTACAPLGQLTQEGLQAAGERLEREALGVPHVRGAELLSLVQEAAQSFLSHPEAADREAQLAAFAAECAHIGSAAQLFAALRAMTARQLDALLEQQRAVETRPIRQARAYVQQHYSEPITLESVCEAAGFSASYFSALFKRETGENFVKYLTRVRIDRAKELLQHTNLSVADICSRVGYNDLKHFTQTFKKETSLSPAQYRRLYG